VQIQAIALGFAVSLSERDVRLERILEGAGLKLIARVRESNRATDLAVVSGDGLLDVIRCVDRPSSQDYHALKTMLAQGDFTRAVLVYTAEDQPHLSGEIKSYPLSRIDELAASLARESDP
jgi:hypothetical protein